MTNLVETAPMPSQESQVKARSPFWSELAWSVGPIILGLIITTIALLAVGSNPLQAYAVMWLGAFGDPVRVGNVALAWVPILLASIGLLITFTAGLWNIGIEGQIVFGAIFTTWAA
jgi:simple sugar transport system permease protein